MDWQSFYTPPNELLWQGRPDLSNQTAFFQHIQYQDLIFGVKSPQKPSFALLGFKCDEGIKRNYGRIGAKEGPDAIRKMLSSLAFPSKEIICFDVGDINCENQSLEKAQDALSQAVYLLVKNNITPIVLGGGHEMAWGHFQGLTQAKSALEMTIINFDSHFDMRPISDNLSTSGTPFLQIANKQHSLSRPFRYFCLGIQPANNPSFLFETAKANKVSYALAEDFYGEVAHVTQLVDQVLQSQAIYVSICLDVFAQAYAPGVSAPQPLGLSPWQIIPYLRSLAQSKKVLSYDIAELSPTLDSQNKTAKLAANLVYEILNHHAFA